MGWTFSGRHGKSVTDMVKVSYEWENDTSKTEVLAHSINVRVGVAYLAVKSTIKASGISYVWAGVALIKLVPRDYYDFGIKEMDETVGPCERDCPKRILDLLTPLDEMATLQGEAFRADSWAAQWRADCHANLAKKAVRGVLKHGDVITLKTPVRFTDGRERGTFKVSRNGRKVRFISLTDGAMVRISKNVLAEATVG